MSHPNVITAHDAGEADGIHYLVTEYVEGRDLAQLVRDRGPLPVAEAIDLTIQAARGLAYAHGRGLIHRDVKPQNLIVGGDGVVKLLDLGVSRLEPLGASTDADVTRDGVLVGTAAYMAPEQAADAHVADARADVYGLGCTLYSLLTGRPPYDGTSLAGVILAHRDREIPSLREARPDVPSGLDALFRRMLAKAPGDRPASMAEVIASLESCRAESPSSSAPAPGPAPLPTQPDTALRAADLDTDDDVAPAVPSPGPRLRGRGWWPVAASLVLLALAGAMYASGVILRVKTRAGTLVVQVDEPGAEVTVDGEVVTVRTPGDGKPVEVSVAEGDHILTVRKGGFETRTESFRVRSGQKETVRVWLEPPERARAQPKPQPTAAAGAPAAGADPMWRSCRVEDAWISGVVARPAGLPGLVHWQMEMRKPRRGIASVAWSPDGHRIACGSNDGTVRIYASDSLEIVQMLIGHRGPTGPVAWSPDGRRLATGGLDSTDLWDSGGTPVGVLRDSGDACAVRWSPDGERLALFSGNGNVRTFDLGGFEVASYKVGNPSAPRDLSWAPDSRRIVVGDLFGRVGVWDTATGEGREIGRQEPHVGGVDWSGDGRWIASGGGDNLIHLWEPDGTPGPVLGGHQSSVTSVAWQPRGSTLASVSQDGTCRLWQADGTPGLILIREGAPPEQLADVAWSPDGKRLATAGWSLRVWDVEGHLLRELTLEDRQLDSVAWAPDGRTVAAGCWDGSVRLFGRDGTPGPVLRAPGQPLAKIHRPTSRYVAWSPDGRTIATGGPQNRGLHLWDADGTLRRSFWSDAGRFSAVAWSPDGRHLAGACMEDFSIRTATAEGEPGPAMQGPTEWITALLLERRRPLPRGGSVGPEAAASLGRRRRAERPSLEAGGNAYDVAAEPGGTRLASLHPDGLRVWSADGSLESTRKLGLPAAMLWPPRGEVRLVGVVGHTQLTLTPDDRPFDSPLLWGQDHEVISAAFDPAGERIASASRDRTLYCWDVQAKEPLWVALVLDGGECAVFNAAGQLIHGDPDLVAEQMACVVQEPDRGLRLMDHRAFRERYPGAIRVAAHPGPADRQEDR
ncbi:MAG: protein kinase [Isosphaeraceae bacterium]